MVLAISKNGPKFYLNLVAMILIMFVFRIITPPEGLTSEGPVSYTHLTLPTSADV